MRGRVCACLASCVRVCGSVLVSGGAWVLSLCICVCACSSVCACAAARVCLCMRAFVPAGVRVYLHFYRQACVCSACVREWLCVCIAAVRALLWHGMDGRSRRAGCSVCVLRWSSACSPASAAGVTWTSRTTSAPWAARPGHTSVIDAAGAIYVIGGFDGNTGTYYNDVWVSTDGGADRTRAG